MTDAQVQQVIDAILNATLLDNWHFYLISFFVSLISISGFAFLKSYYTQKGKYAALEEKLDLIEDEAKRREDAKFKAIQDNLGAIKDQIITQEKAKYQAIEESLDIIKEQVKATTETAEEVKAKIDRGSWVYQKKWEFRKDIYLDLMKKLLQIRLECLEAEKILDKVNKFSSEDDEEWEQHKDACIAAAEEIYDGNVHKLTNETRAIVNEKGILFISEDVLTVISAFFNAEKIRQKNAWKDLVKKIESGEESYHSVGSYDSYEDSLYHKSAAAERAYMALVKLAEHDLLLK